MAGALGKSGPSALAPLADIGEVPDSDAMLVKTHISVAAAYLVLSGCGQPTEKLPPLLLDATTTGGSNFLCEGGDEQGSVPETASHSPQIVARLRTAFPPGSLASKLRTSLTRQGFIIHDACSADKSVSWADFQQRGFNGTATYQAAFGTVYWKQDKVGRLTWATGDIAYTGL